jgi:hypothetical protein
VFNVAEVKTRIQKTLDEMTDEAALAMALEDIEFLGLGGVRGGFGHTVGAELLLSAARIRQQRNELAQREK